MSYMAQTTASIPDWSLNSVIVYAQDDQESKAFSLRMNFLVRAVSFTVERTDTGDITVNDPAEFQGEGLPGSLVIARFSDGNAKLNSTRVLSDGSWNMQLNAGQLSGIEGSSDVIFEMDGQIFKFAGQTENAEFAIVVSSGDDGGSGVISIILIVLAVLVLLGAGAFFFIEFEEIPDEDELTGDDSPVEEDPYAWAKAKQTPAIPQEAAAVAPGVEAAAASSQHPGWLWDQATNQWVPDPNYQQPPQQ
jgi:hypothetical protein